MQIESTRTNVRRYLVGLDEQLSNVIIIELILECF